MVKPRLVCEKTVQEPDIIYKVKDEREEDETYFEIRGEGFDKDTMAMGIIFSPRSTYFFIMALV